MPRKESPTSVTEEDEENSYDNAKKRRGRKHNKVLRLPWPVFGMIYCFGTVLLIWRMMLDSSMYRNQLLEQQRYNRAKRLQQERSGRRENDYSIKRKKKSQPKPPSPELEEEFKKLNYDILNNVAGGIRFIRSTLLPPLPGQPENPIMQKPPRGGPRETGLIAGQDPFRVNRRRGPRMAWRNEKYEEKHPKVDYTKHSYEYPDLFLEGPPPGYPKLETLGDMLKRWPQNNLDHPPTPFVEQLAHFNYSDPVERSAARKYRDAELPFKLYDVPEVTLAGIKWTDDYVAGEFDGGSFFRGTSRGTCQESPNHYFAFFTPQMWKVSSMGPPPVRNNDWTFKEWATHARYADSVSLSEDRPHFYWQSGVDREERYLDKSSWTFVSRDLPSFSSPTETFFVFHPEEQKGIQCRFGERGVTAATHYDAGRNMVAMVTGAKRYILSPPRECSKLGIVTQRGHSIFRHSLLNFGNLDYLNTDEGKSMSQEERAWLERAKDSMAIDTVLKAGEVLYIPSHWFHYITSLQKSAQCNVRSGIDKIGTPEFGGAQDVYDCAA